MNNNSGRHAGRRSVRQVLVLVLAFVLVIGAAVGGTLAWLTAQTDEVKNTFTSATLFANPTSDFTLWENEATDDDGDGLFVLSDTVADDGKNDYDILPGVDIPKNPTITIDDLQENAYLYIKVEGTLPTGLGYELDSCWTPVVGYAGVFVYTDDNNSHVIKPGDLTVGIIEDNTITVPSTYSVPEGSDGEGTLTFTAYMTQATGQSDVAVAWQTNFAG